MWIWKKNKNKLKKTIREIVSNIFESGHKQQEIYDNVDELADKLTNIVSGQIKLNTDEWSIKRAFECGEDFYKSTKIKKITINTDFKKGSENKINGTFKTKKTRLLNDGYYMVLININIEFNNSKLSNHKNQIENVLSHELHHAFRYIKTIDKKSKSNRLNTVKNKIAKLEGEFLKKHPSLLEFLKMFYLSLHQEIEARAQEVASSLKYDNKSKTPDETYEYLMQFQPIVDCRKMLNYSTKEVLVLGGDVLEKFIEIFNLELEKEGLKSWEKKNVNSFFDFWENKIVDGGGILKRKINRIISDKYLYEDENKMYDNIDWDIFDEAYGIIDLFLD